MAVSIHTASGQFSPGDLSRPHAHLEGSQQCVSCHEVGKEISGAKCLTCHEEIRNVIKAKHGFHASVSDRRCVTCHKEHLGKDVQTVIFNRKTFDHTATGFALSGKHAGLQCEQCHSESRLKDPFVGNIVRKTGRKSLLGLDASCSSCHADRHAGAVGTECKSCHTPSGWSPAKGFNHANTAFALTGKHVQVECARCHEELTRREQTQLTFSTKSFADCSPCHSSPHGMRFSGQTCRSCHSTESWSSVKSKALNHDLTAFPLRGKHAGVKCENCHRLSVSSERRMRPAHGKCTDCHEDYHKGEFTARYGNDCAQCHTVDGFTPSTFAISNHQATRFLLSGAHLATPCARCHASNTTGKSQFVFADRQCEACHKDPHAGQFASQMADRSCETCHSTSSWKPATFNHDSTTFPLRGKHAASPCSGCHKTVRMAGVQVVRYGDAPSECASCHRDAHAGQFAVDGTVRCERCHVTTSWQTLTFDHNTGSRFILTGAHARAECGACHKKENIAGVMVVRFRPLSVDCESCHGQEGIRQ